MKNRIIEFHNRLSDKTFVWFPFQFLRPAQDHLITQARIILMTLCFGIYGLLALTIRYFFLDELIWSRFLQGAAYVFFGFFVWFQLVTSRLWNIRAKQLMLKRDQNE